MSVFGQDSQKENQCLSRLDKSYVTDGQDHNLIIYASKYTHINLFFYPEFTYRIIACCNNQTVPIELTLNDNKGTQIFSNEKVNYKRDWDFTSESFLRGILHIKLASNEYKDQTIKIIIGYKLTGKK
jgi:hypothetical protein